MKVTHNTPDLLIASEIPWFISMMLLFFILVFVGLGLFLLTEHWAGLIFIFGGGGLGLGAMSVFSERLQLIMDANAGTMTMRSRRIFGRDEIITPLEDVIRAGTETSLSNADGINARPRQTLSRLAFLVDDGSGTGRTTILPMTAVMSSGNGAAAVTRAVNLWLKELRGTDQLEA